MARSYISKLHILETSNSGDTKNAGPVGAPRLPNYIFADRAGALEVELHSELDEARELRPCDGAHAGAKACVGCVQSHRVGEVDEVAAELHFSFFRKHEVLLETEIEVPGARTVNGRVAAVAEAGRGH